MLLCGGDTISAVTSPTCDAGGSLKRMDVGGHHEVMVVVVAGVVVVVVVVVDGGEVGTVVVCVGVVVRPLEGVVLLWLLEAVLGWVWYHVPQTNCSEHRHQAVDV